MSSSLTSGHSTSESPAGKPVFYPPVCPLRRLARGDSPAHVLQEFSARIDDMPPDHVMLMQKFQQDEKARKELDERFGHDKEAMLLHLWETHRTMFRPLDKLGDQDQSKSVKKWLQDIKPDSSEPMRDEVQVYDDDDSNIEHGKT